MSTEAVAIIGLFLGLWSHEQMHRYEERQTRLRLLIAAVLGAAAIGFLAVAGLRAIGVIR